MKIFFSVGEPSGDLHGANLIRELRRRDPEVQCVGYGGPRMAAAGCRLHEDLTSLAVMFITRVLLNLHKFWTLWRRADHYLRTERPDAVVLIDYPGFNWWIARSAKKHSIPVFYYGVPQMWAWAGWRVKKMRRLVDHVLCKLPFEADWFRAHGCCATYLGHPYFDEVSQRKLDHEFARTARGDGRLVAILPGSRTQEVLNNLPSFLKAAGQLQQMVPEARFAIAAFNDQQAALCREMVVAANLPIAVFVGRTPELIEAAHCCFACSGSVSLELLYHRKPTVILYQVTRTVHFLQQYFLQVPYITLVNLLATDGLFSGSGKATMERLPPAEMPFPEYLTWKDASHEMAAHAEEWLRDPEAYRRKREWLAELCEKYAHPGASQAAADYVMRVIAPPKPKHRVPAPHFPVRDAA